MSPAAAPEDPDLPAGAWQDDTDGEAGEGGEERAGGDDAGEGRGDGRGGGRRPRRDEPEDGAARRLGQRELLERLDGFAQGLVRVAAVTRTVTEVLARDFREHPWKAAVAMAPVPGAMLIVPALMFAHYALSGRPEHKAALSDIVSAARDPAGGRALPLDQAVRAIPGSGAFEIDGWKLVKALAADTIAAARAALTGSADPAVSRQPATEPPPLRAPPDRPPSGRIPSGRRRPLIPGP